MVMYHFGNVQMCGRDDYNSGYARARIYQSLYKLLSPVTVTDGFACCDSQNQSVMVTA